MGNMQAQWCSLCGRLTCVEIALFITNSLDADYALTLRGVGHLSSPRWMEAM